MRDGIQQNDEAVSPVIGAILILAIGITIITNVQLNFVPVWNAREELNHLEKMNDDFKELKSGIDSGAVSGTALSSSLHMGFKYSPKLIVYNPRESAYASLSIQNNTWAEIRYNEVLPEGMTSDTSIKNVSTSTITYALLGAQNLSSFICEHGLIRRSGSDYTASSQTLVSNNTLYLLGVKSAEPETIIGVERRVVNIYPASPPENSVIGKNVWLILHTNYADWWTDIDNPSSIQNQGGVIKKKDSVNGTIIAYFDAMVIRMGEAQVTTLSKKPPAHLPPHRLVKITPQSVNLPIEGIHVLEVEVQDYYNNPVPNTVVSFSINTTRTPANACSTAALLQNSAVSGADGRANIMLRTGGAGIYYIDASITSYTTTFTYPASSQGGFISLAYNGSEPLYNLTATLRDGTGELDTGKTIFFEAGGNTTVAPFSNSTDSNGNASTVLNTTNATGMDITNIQTAGVTNTSAIITWDTINTITVAANRTPGGYIFSSIDVPTRANSSGCVRYGTSSGNYPDIICDVFASSHSINLTGLQPYTAYYFIVNSSRPDMAGINSSEYMFVTIPAAAADTTPPASITNLTNATYAPLYINWTWNDPADADFDHVEVYIDGVFKSNVVGGVQFYNASYFRPNSTHTIAARTVDTSGNVNMTWENRTAATSSVFTYVFDFLNITGTLTNFVNMQNATDNGASAALAEEITQFEWFFNASNESWVFSSTVIFCEGGAVCTVSAGNSSMDGIPPGSLFANLTVTGPNKEGIVETSWRSPDFTVNEIPANASLYFSLRNTSSAGSSLIGTFNVTLIKPDSSRTLIYPTTTISASSAWLNFSNISISSSDFSQSGNYSILLNAALDVISTLAPSKIGFLEVRWDNPTITLNYTANRLNITTNTTNIPNTSTQQVLQIRYNISGGNFTLLLWNGSTWNGRTELNDTAMSYCNITLMHDELIQDGTLVGNAAAIDKYYVLVRYLDVDPGAVQQGRLYLDYQRVCSR